MNLIAWFLHLALAIVPPQTTPVTIDCFFKNEDYKPKEGEK